MALTRANVESIIVARCGALMTVAGMAVTVVGSNADLNDPIGRAIRDLGYLTDNVASISDADVGQVGADEYDQLLDLAEYHALENILGNYDDVDLTQGPRTEKFSQTISQLERRIATLAKKLERNYGFGMATPLARVITLSFAEHGSNY